ncbi:MAG: hypothetical protein P0Y64_09985 [Candidatus Sphingomonas colombiensis]|nr:hypothetical protein [Sphingomonas sp.]WEK41745.1 MAG: hypothetical protein P0Y64_09985 [Sphingomonas sp.]
MAATYRLKGLGWFGGVVIVSLGFYLVSLQVAAERKRLEQLNGRIGLAQRDIRALETEFDVRSNLTQLERWNGDTLALASPTAGQFVRDEGQLASINFDRAAPMPGQQQGEIRTAALVVPSLPSPIAPAQVIDEAPAVARPAALVKVASRPVEPDAPKLTAAVVLRTAVVAPTPVAESRKGKAVAMLDKSLLSDTTLGDLASGARAEARRLR